MKVVLCTIIVVITLNLIRKITLNMLCSVPCCEVRHFFFSAFPWEALGYKNFEFTEVGYRSDILYNHRSDNLEPNSKDISGYAVLCSLLRGSTDCFFWLSNGKALGYQKFEF